MRITQATIHFSSSFLLYGFDAPQPAGRYIVDYGDEVIEGNSWLAYRRIGTFIHLPAIGVLSTTRQIVQIDAADLEAALVKDQDAFGATDAGQC
jgi:hypothetical protein